jgi:hypothetical protein
MEADQVAPDACSAAGLNTIHLTDDEEPTMSMHDRGKDDTAGTRQPCPACGGPVPGVPLWKTCTVGEGCDMVTASVETAAAMMADKDRVEIMTGPGEGQQPWTEEEKARLNEALEIMIRDGLLDVMEQAAVDEMPTEKWPEFRRPMAGAAPEDRTVLEAERVAGIVRRVFGQGGLPDVIASILVARTIDVAELRKEQIRLAGLLAVLAGRARDVVGGEQRPGGGRLVLERDMVALEEAVDACSPDAEQARRLVDGPWSSIVEMLREHLRLTLAVARSDRTDLADGDRTAGIVVDGLEHDAERILTGAASALERMEAAAAGHSDRLLARGRRQGLDKAAGFAERSGDGRLAAQIRSLSDQMP